MSKAIPPFDILRALGHVFSVIRFDAVSLEVSGVRDLCLEILTPVYDPVWSEA
jgi:hypothetical protein